MDAVPGMPTSFTFTATKTTEEMREELNDPEFNYEIACTEVLWKRTLFNEINFDS